MESDCKRRSDWPCHPSHIAIKQNENDPNGEEERKRRGGRWNEMAARQVMRIQFTPNKKIRVIFYERASRFRAVYRACPLTGANVLTRERERHNPSRDIRQPSRRGQLKWDPPLEFYAFNHAHHPVIVNPRIKVKRVLRWLSRLLVSFSRVKD